jgi:hypothetical protein
MSCWPEIRWQINCGRRFVVLLCVAIGLSQVGPTQAGALPATPAAQWQARDWLQRLVTGFETSPRPLTREILLELSLEIEKQGGINIPVSLQQQLDQLHRNEDQARLADFRRIEQLISTEVEPASSPTPTQLVTLDLAHTDPFLKHYQHRLLAFDRLSATTLRQQALLHIASWPLEAQTDWLLELARQEIMAGAIHLGLSTLKLAQIDAYSAPRLVTQNALLINVAHWLDQYLTDFGLLPPTCESPEDATRLTIATIAQGTLYTLMQQIRELPEAADRLAWLTELARITQQLTPCLATSGLFVQASLTELDDLFAASTTHDHAFYTLIHYIRTIRRYPTWPGITTHKEKTHGRHDTLSKSCNIA